MTQLSPIVNQSFLYAYGLTLSWGSNTTLSVAAGQARDSNNVIDMATTAATTINAAVNGINGLDTGTFAASTWYYVYMVGDSTNYSSAGFVISLSATVPTLPTGYDSYRRIGCALSDGSTHFLKFTQTGNATTRDYMWDSTISVLSGGTSATLALVTLTAGVPPLANLPVTFQVSFTPATANDYVSLATPGSSATLLPNLSGVVAAKIQTGQLTQVSGISSSVAKIQYINSAASGATSLWVCAFKDAI